MRNHTTRPHHRRRPLPRLARRVRLYVLNAVLPYGEMDV